MAREGSEREQEEERVDSTAKERRFLGGKEGPEKRTPQEKQKEARADAKAHQEDLKSPPTR